LSGGTSWAIVSSPMVLSFDLNNATTFERVWPVISNAEVLDVNRAWAGEVRSARCCKSLLHARGLPVLIGNRCPANTTYKGC
jgi:hypothetical protein